MGKKIFYRVANTNSQQGLWYNMQGEFTGLIHNEFSFCANSELPMPYDESVRGYLSTTDTLENLYFWFPPEDLVRLNKHGIYLSIYEATDYREYENHWIINQESSVLLERRVQEFNVDDPIAFGFNYNGGEPEEIIVSRISSINSDGSLNVHFLYGYKSLSETIKPEDVIAIGRKGGGDKIYGWSGKYDILKPNHKLLSQPVY